MKKRLLSAALALAMALTLLPVSVFADYDNPVSGDIKGDGTERVQYINYIDANHPQRGWYVTHNYPAVTNTAPQKPAKSVDFLVTSGVSVGGMYYTSATGGSITEASGVVTNTTIYNYTKNGNTFTQTSLKGAVIVIGGSQTIDVKDATTTISLDVYGGTATLTNSGGKLTSVTVNNSLYTTYGFTTKGTIDGLDNLDDYLTSITLKHVSCADNVVLDSKVATTNAGQTHSVTLDDASLGTIQLNGVGANTPVTQAAQTVNISNKSTFGNITVTGNGSTVTLNNVPGNGSSTVSMTGIGGSFNFTGGGAIGGLTVNGSATGDANNNEVSGAPASISIGTDCTVGSINGTMPTEKTSGTNTVSISGIVSGATNLKNSNVTISGGNIGALSVGAGTVTVSGNRSVVDNVTLARATFNLTGSNCTIGSLAVGNVGSVTADATKVTFTVPKDPSNTLGTTSASVTSYTKKTISGGTWLTNVPAANLSDAVEYQLAVPAVGGSNTFTYYTADQLGEAVLKQGATGGSVLIQVDVTSATQVVTFKNGAITWGELRVVPGTTIPQLPTQMNSVATPYWSDGIFNNLSGSYNTPNPTDAASPLKTAVTLDAGGGGAVTGTVTKLTGVKVGATDSNITASLVGNVITLSGAVTTSQKQFDLTLETDAVKEDGGKDVPVTIKVSVQRSGNTLSFVHPGNLSLGNGVVMENDFKTITLGNGTKYTLNGSGLVERNNTIKVVGLDSTTRAHTFSARDIDVIVNVPGYNTDTQKQTIINVVNGSASFTLTNSPAVQKAINAALATITESQVTQFRQSARQKAWSDNGIRGVALTDTTATAYDSSDICLVPYLEVTVTDYKPATTASNATLTANLTLKWRVEIEAAAGTDPKANKAANLVSDDGTYIAKTGTALNFSGDLTKSDGTGGVVITFDSGVTGATYAHQNSTYDYSITTNAFTVTHAGTNNNLGTFVLDKVTPLVQLGAKPSGGAIVPGAPVKYYSTLQAAVDDAEDGQYILVDSAYGGSMNITMTGKAREIQIQANGKNVVVANASGGLVSENNTGSLYTIKLNRDNTVAAGNVDIAANTAQNGSITVSASKAKAGDVITITAAPNQGYKVNTITAATNTGAAVAVSATGTLNQYTLTVPANTTKVTVTPTFVVGDNKATFSVNTNTTRGTASVYTGTSDGKVEQGKSATVTVVPANGNRTMGLTAYGNNGATAPVSRTGTNSFNVTVPSGATTVTVTPSFDVDNGTPFSDVLSSHWASNEISWAYRNGYTSGKDTAYTYKPADYITRGEVVAMLWKAANSPVVNYANPFKDVPTNYWAYNAVMWAASKGLIDTSTGYFNGTGYINRADTVVILYKQANSPTVYGTSGFADVASSAYYSRAVTWARQQGLTNGYSGKTYFRPSYAISRAEVATFLYRAFG